MDSSFERAVSRLAVGCVLVVGGTTVGFGQVVISELMPNPTVVTDANGEWFELYNAGTDDVVIHGWKIKDDATASQMHQINSPGLTIEDGEYLLFAVNGDSATNGGLPMVDYVYTLSGGSGTARTASSLRTVWMWNRTASSGPVPGRLEPASLWPSLTPPSTTL